MSFSNAEKEHTAYMRIVALWYARGRIAEGNLRFDANVFAQYVEFSAYKYHNGEAPLYSIEHYWDEYVKIREEQMGHLK